MFIIDDTYIIRTWCIKNDRLFISS